MRSTHGLLRATQGPIFAVLMAAGAPFSAHALTVNFDDITNGGGTDLTANGSGTVSFFNQATTNFSQISASATSYDDVGSATAPHLGLQGFALTTTSAAQGQFTALESGYDYSGPLTELLAGSTSGDAKVDSVVFYVNGSVVDTYDNGGTGYSGAFSVDWTLSSFDGDVNDLKIEINVSSGSDGGDIVFTNAQITAVPIPGAAWLFGSALFGVAVVGRRRMAGKSVA